MPRKLDLPQPLRMPSRVVDASFLLSQPSLISERAMDLRQLQAFLCLTARHDEKASPLPLAWSAAIPLPCRRQDDSLQDFRSVGLPYKGPRGLPARRDRKSRTPRRFAAKRSLNGRILSSGPVILPASGATLRDLRGLGQFLCRVVRRTTIMGTASPPSGSTA